MPVITKTLDQELPAKSIQLTKTGQLSDNIARMEQICTVQAHNPFPMPVPGAIPQYSPITLKMENNMVIPRDNIRRMPTRPAKSLRKKSPIAATTASSGQGVWRSQSTYTMDTYYLWSFDGRLMAEYDNTGQCTKEYIYLGSRLIAEYNPQTQKYFYQTQDQINSTRMVTDDTGAVVYSAAHGPYGGMQKQWVNQHDPKQKYSGKERESYSSYDYFGARYYDHNTFRFTSPDPVMNKDEALGNPQLWNLYAYCNNNPITNRDPDGRAIALAIPLINATSPLIVKLGAAIAGAILGKVLYDSISPLTNNPEREIYPVPIFDSKKQDEIEYLAESSTLGESITRMREAERQRINISLSKGGNKNIKDTGLSTMPTTDIRKKARDKSLQMKDRQRYIREEKARKVRNSKKRK